MYLVSVLPVMFLFFKSRRDAHWNIWYANAEIAKVIMQLSVVQCVPAMCLHHEYLNIWTSEYLYALGQLGKSVWTFLVWSE